jgi:hypothetical protein
MKIVLKRRKHRKGIRPKRKGTLKVRMVTLPTKDEHSKAITALMTFRDKHAPLDTALELLQAGKGVEADRILKVSQKGYDYFREHRQAATIDIALPAITGESPEYFIRKEFDKTPTCKACTHDCPFTDMNLSEDRLVRMCPFVRHAFHDYVLDKSNILPLDQSDMAELALTHLS